MLMTLISLVSGLVLRIVVLALLAPLSFFAAAVVGVLLGFI